VSAQDARAARLAGELEELELDALLVDSLVDVRYLTGFTGSQAMALVVSDAARARVGGHRFLSDFRYETQSAEQVADCFEREIVTGEALEALAALLARPEGRTPSGGAPPPGAHPLRGQAGRRAGGEASGRLGFEEASTSVKAHRRLAELLGEGWELVPCAGLVERLRAVKDAEEVARIRAASELADEALRMILEDGVVGRGERDVAIELELRMRRLGAQAPSFPSIVAAGPHGALPHAEPRAQEIPRDVLVTIDWGAVLDGYCSDCTRTYATGEGIPAQAREVYELVLAAERRGVQAMRAGPSGRELDALARELIEQAGHGEHFGHGLGHGVGMEVHEGPRLSRTAPEDPLRAGNVVTVEPGVYLPGVLGVRIEDLVVVGEDGCEVLTSLPRDLAVIS
jgi:Xaa-Pro aminopeptidase